MNPRDSILSRSGSVHRAREGYWTFWPDSLPPQIDWTAALLARLAEAERSLGELRATARLLPGFPAFFPLLAAREACLSCRIDSIHVDLLELLQSWFFPKVPLAEKAEVRAARSYLEALLSAGDRRSFSLDSLAGLHARIIADAGGAGGISPGFRSGQNWIGPPGSTLEGARFIPPPPERLERALEQLEAFINDPSDLPPTASLGLIHYQFEALHPFPSGNGRLGRILIANLPVLWGGFSLPLVQASGFFLANQEAYFNHLLSVSQSSAWGDWLAFFFQALSSSARSAADLLAGLQTLISQYRDILSAGRPVSRLTRLLDFVAAHPVFSVRQVETAMGVNFAVAQRYVDQFEDYGIVEEITGQARNRIYCARGMLEIIIETM